MASNDNNANAQLIQDTRNLLWGTNLKEEVFLRWTQGFEFSADEMTALIQYEGGPCAVIAPVEAYLLKHALFSQHKTDNLSQVSEAERSTYLLDALGEILFQLSTNRYILMYLDLESNGENSEQESATVDEESGETNRPKRRRLDQETFHSRLRCIECDNATSMKDVLQTKISDYSKTFGILLYLYSVIMSKGIEQIKNEVEDPGEPLIDGIHGHGSQSLINLILTGRAMSNVWDNDKDVSGLKLQGIKSQSTIGFLTLVEHLRYCEVGWNLKNPKYPIWILGSETHLTVLFSRERNLVIHETKESYARQMFQNFDPEDNGYIPTSVLGDLMSALDLVAETEYVNIMKTKLDFEDLGVITKGLFMEEFFPGESVTDIPREFILYHYNGLQRSCPEKKIQYQKGKATLLDEPEVQIITDTSHLKLCLLTKWPTIEVTWNNSHIPSLN